MPGPKTARCSNQPASPRPGTIQFRAGAPWRDVPERFGDWKNIHRRFSRWAANGVWERLFKTLADDPDNAYAMIDATIVRAYQHSAGARKKGAKTQPSAARAAA